MQRMLDIIFARDRVVPEIPVCSDHHVEMRLRGTQGRPARFTDQSEEQYTLIYFCPVEGCNHTDSRDHARTQIPVAGASPERPLFSRRG